MLSILLSPLMVPHVVLGIALLRMLTQMGFGGSFGGMVAGHTVLVMPYVLRLVVASASGIQEHMSERFAALLAA